MQGDLLQSDAQFSNVVYPGLLELISAQLNLAVTQFMGAVGQ